jgi:hypothetical protein
MVGAGRVKMTWPDRRLVRWVAVGMAAAYVASVLVLAVVKVALPVLAVLPKVASRVLEALPWPELLYGPALSAGITFALICLASSVRVGTGGGGKAA